MRDDAKESGSASGSVKPRAMTRIDGMIRGSQLEMRMRKSESLEMQAT